MNDDYAQTCRMDRIQQRRPEAFPPTRCAAACGFAVYQAQAGLRHRDAKPLKGLGSGVLEVVARHDGDTFRAVYTVRFETAVYVLHAFQKKARRGIATPKQEFDLVGRRLRAAEEHYRDTHGGG